ncbi:MAG: SusC/RagA family TonB-linked outer membrane protein [Mucilaginibacter polytrichastri]|nr:SusC/RagA family TonB-linked outer membrane protein [Mucilaginibacter polytrichastri]
MNTHLRNCRAFWRADRTLFARKKGKKRPLLFLLFFLFLAISASAQNQQTLDIRGHVVDETDGQPLIGVTVMDAQKKTMAVTDAGGNFAFKTPAGSAVQFSMIGYETLSRTFSSGEKGLIIRMKNSSRTMDEVVVTALGIKREEKSLGYAVSTVKGEQLTEALSNNWSDALSGKVAGLNLVRSNGGPAGSNKIILRGENNLTGGAENEALIVVDGVVMNQGSGRRTAPSGTGAYLDSDSPSDYGSSINDINPEDIESVSVLKGPGASALYGQRGANGAIIITTKSGGKKKGLGISINSNTAFEDINRWPSLQYEYGQGVEGASYYSYNASEDGASTRSTSSAWGPRFDGQLFYQYDPITHTKSTVRTPWVPYVNDSRRFFETGATYTNSISLDGGNDKTTARFSATNVNNTWIIPNTGYKRNTVALSVNQKVNDKLQIATKINYTNKSSDNLPSAGYNNQSIMYWYMFWEPSASIDWLKDYWMPGQENRMQSYPFSSFPDNPYLIAHEMLNKTNRNGITGNIQATYNFTKELNLMVRTSLDFSYDQRSQQRPYDTEKFKKGMYRTQNIYSQEQNTDFLLRYSKKINQDFDISASAGGSMLVNRYNRDENRADSLLYPGQFNLANRLGVLTPLPYRSQYNINSFYGLISAGFRNYLFLDVTGRNDWNSVLASPVGTGNVSFFYPSVNASAILSEIFTLPKAVSYAKLRASFADVGSGLTTPYRTSYAYEPVPNYQGGYGNPTTLANPNLKPLLTRSYEIGADLKFLNNRVGIDVALYKGNTRNQILTSIVDRSSGVNTAVINAGEVQNKGVEIGAFGNPVRTEDFQWKINATFTANRNKVMALTDSLSQLTLQTGPGSRGAINAIVGGSMGDLYGRGYQRAPDGQIIYSNGIPQLTTDVKYLGNTIPKFRTSLNNEFRYKQFRLNVLFDAQFGAVAYSLTNAVLAEQGKSTLTLPGRYNGIIGNGVIQNADGSFRPNDVIAQDITAYYTAHSGRDNVEGNTFSTDFLKLREARFDYTLPARFAKKVGLQRAAIGIYARNLYTWTAWPIFDPEFGTLSGTDITQGFELGQFPSTRTVGFNLVLGI